MISVWKNAPKRAETAQGKTLTEFFTLSMPSYLDELGTSPIGVYLELTPALAVAV
ncbi:hypothetical protein H6F90_27945 [Trichocoleus sp. FACHB-591]|nr:hypothetical protein [Trichocoleus sp. FACHB-591]